MVFVRALGWSLVGLVTGAMGCGKPAPPGGAGETGATEEDSGDTAETDEGTEPCPGSPYEDGLVEVSVGSGSEVVDVEFAGRFVILCGGFGADVTDVSDPAAPDYLDVASSRCQNAGFGTVLDDGTQVFYVAHHGDSFELFPYLQTFHISPEGEVIHQDTIEDLDVLFEGLGFAGEHLYVTAHAGGLRVYATDEIGTPELVTVLPGFVNAGKLEIAGSHAFVGDGAGGVKVVSLEEPTSPSLVGTIDMAGLPRDLDIEGDRLYVALGGDGVEEYDITDPTQPVLTRRLDALGSVQAVDRDGDLLAVAAWSHAAVYSAASFELLATERVKPPPGFEQDLGIALAGVHAYVGEWEGLHILEYREGIEAPDVWLEQELVSFPDADSDRVVVVRNVGTRPLEVCGASVSDPAFGVDFTPMTVSPGEAGAFEVHYSPPAEPELAYLTLYTDDPDPGQAELRLLLETDSEHKLGVGDALDADFGFLDPGGDITGLEGQVTVLAYFALF